MLFLIFFASSWWETSMRWCVFNNHTVVYLSFTFLQSLNKFVKSLNINGIFISLCMFIVYGMCILLLNNRIIPRIYPVDWNLPVVIFSLPYNEFFGGVSGLTVEQFRKINGFPNAFWGWGGEDDDLWNRWVFTEYVKISDVQSGGK